MWGREASVAVLPLSHVLLGSSRSWWPSAEGRFVGKQPWPALLYFLYPLLTFWEAYEE